MTEEFNGLPIIDPEIKAFISTAEGFERRFIKNFAHYTRQEDAYELTERQYEFITGQRKYSNFDSFRSSRNRKSAQHNRRKTNPLAKKRPFKK